MTHLYIDACNIKAGGGLTHLKELLCHADFNHIGFSQVTVFASSFTLHQLPDRPWLLKASITYLDKGIFYVWFWRLFIFRKIVNKNCLAFIPGGGSIGSRYVTMCQNLLPVEHKEMQRYFFSKVWLRLFLLKYLHKYSYKWADGVIFFNDYSKIAVSKYLNVLPKSSIIIPHGINSRFLKTKKSYTWKNVFKLLYVSIIDEYKHQWNVAEAVMQLNSEGYPIELSLVGPEYYLSRKRLNRVLSTKKFSNRIKILGKINYEDLDIIYSQMDACIYASSCETFGMTLLEAMASSMPIACSNRSSMPELLKDSGIYFNPEKIEELKKSILTLMLDEQLRKYLGQKAHNYAKDYKWETTSKETFSYLYNIACRDVG